ncbi:phosphodiester glycosidase family protein [Botrimarina colliarenosi]|nr:phosphodiester glycosidase family protein [Botrimarina colliarenosi]
MNTRRLAIVVALVFAATSGVAGAPRPDWPAEPGWTPQFVGVDSAAITITEPRPLRAFVLRVDLDADGLSLVTDDDNGDRPEEVDGLKTSTFLLQKKCQAAINATGFWPGQKEEERPQNVAGLVVSAGKLVSPVDTDKPRAALVVRENRRAAIVRPPVDLSGVVTAIGGYGVIVEGGAVVRPKNEIASFIDSLHPRTAVGVGDGGRLLYLVVVDGRQPGYSEGVDLNELGELLRRLGADDAVNLDGGGSTTLVVETTGGAFRLVNQPIDGKVPGTERVSACHLGVYASPLPKISPQPPQSP